MAVIFEKGLQSRSLHFPSQAVIKCELRGKTVKGKNRFVLTMCIWLQKICQGSSWPSVTIKKRTSDSSPKEYATSLLEEKFRTRLIVTDRLNSGRNLADDHLIAESSSTVHSLVGMLVECISFYIFEITPLSWIHLQFSLPIVKASYHHLRSYISESNDSLVPRQNNSENIPCKRDVFSSFRFLT